MRTEWDSSKPQQQNGMWVMTGIMADESKNSFRITVTTPLTPKSNRLDLIYFAGLQLDSEHQKIDIMFSDSAPSNTETGRSYDVVLGNLSINIVPIRISSKMAYTIDLSETIEDELAAFSTRYIYEINNTNLFVSCSVQMGEVRMTAANESVIVKAVNTAQITRSSPSPVVWQILFECLAPQNRFSIKLTDVGGKQVS